MLKANILLCSQNCTNTKTSLCKKSSSLSSKSSQYSSFTVSFSTSCMCVCSYQMLAGIQLHVWDARLLCSPGMNPSEQSLEYSLLNMGEGHIVQPFSAPFPNEQTYGHGAPWTCLGDQNYLALELPLERGKVHAKGGASPTLLKQKKDKEEVGGCQQHWSSITKLLSHIQLHRCWMLQTL